MLAQSPSSIVTDPCRYLTTIHGDAGVGKTSWVQQIPGHYLLYGEAGIEGVKVFGDPILSWDGDPETSFIAKCTEIVKAKGDGFKDQREITTIGIDTYEKLYGYCATWVCENFTFPEKGIKMKYSRIEDVPYGKGYARTSETLIGALQKLMLYGFGVVCVSHTKERIVKWAGQELTGLGPDLPPSVRDTLINACGAVGYFMIDAKVERDAAGEIQNIEQGRYQYWQPTFLRIAKHRLPMPERLDLPYGLGYHIYLKAFHEAVEEHKKREQTIQKLFTTEKEGEQ